MKKLLPPLLLLLTTLAAAPSSAPSTSPTYPPNWAPGLDKEVAGSKPLLMNLWDAPAPNQLPSPPKPERDDGTARIYDVNTPGLLLYQPPSNAGVSPATPPANVAPTTPNTCIIECMGGSYTHLTRLVGADNTLPFFLPNHIAVVSLKYRLKTPSADPERDAVLDGQRALRLVRAHAAEWNIDPHKIGMLGWSAGGNLILSLTTHLLNNGDGDPNSPDPVERQSCRPDFIVLLSPWPNGKPITNYPAPKNAPPTFIGNAKDDNTAPFTFAKSIQSSWEAAGNTVEFMEIATGGHGAFEPLTGTAKDWPATFLPWLEKQNLWKKP